MLRLDTESIEATANRDYLRNWMYLRLARSTGSVTRGAEPRVHTFIGGTLVGHQRMTDLVDVRSTNLENELIRCCARVAPSRAVAARIEDLAADDLDWQIVVKRSWWHRIRPLTYRHLRSQPAGLVPQGVLEELHQHASELTIRNQRLATALRDVAQMFEDSGHRALVFKGPSLAQDAYGELALRECGDLDLLIHPNDFSAVESMLRSHGFQSQWDHGESNRQVFACEFERRDAALDVHWDLAPGWLNYHVDFTSFWCRGTPLMPNGDFFRKLAPEDAIVVLSIHGTKHWWERWRWICDVAELVNRGLITDWDELERSAQHANASRSTYLGLWLARTLLSAKLPSDVAGRLDAVTGLPRLGSQIEHWLTHAEQANNVRRLSARFLFRMGVCERIRDCLPQVVRYLVARPS